MDYRLDGGEPAEKGRVTSAQSGRKSVGLPTLAGRKAGIWRKTEGAGLGHRVEQADMSMHRLQNTPVSQAKQGCKCACMCVCVLGTSESLPIAS